MTTATVLQPARPARRAAPRGVMVYVLLGSGPALAANGFLIGPGNNLPITVHRSTDLSGEFRVLPGDFVDSSTGQAGGRIALSLPR